MKYVREFADNLMVCGAFSTVTVLLDSKLTLVGGVVTMLAGVLIRALFCARGAR